MPSASERYPNDQEIVEFFCQAMTEGWAGNCPKVTITDLPGSKVITFEDEDLKLVDLYFVGLDSLKSSGTTIIWYQNQPIWIMHYGGIYPKRVIPFVKRALLANYEHGRFVGGRGPRLYDDSIDPDYLYINQIREGDASSFSGREEVLDRKTKGGMFGFHEYWGMRLM